MATERQVCSLIAMAGADFALDTERRESLTCHYVPLLFVDQEPSNDELL